MVFSWLLCVQNQKLQRFVFPVRFLGKSEILFLKFNFRCFSAFLIPGFFFSGIVWPIESMNPIVQRFANILPLTLPVNALRYILSRGQDMRFVPIVSGFTVLFVHMGIIAFLTVVTFKFKTMT